MRRGNILDQVAMEPSLKTEAPGLHGDQALGPQAWPGTFLPHPPPLPNMYSRKSYAGGRGQARLTEEGGSRLKRRKRVGGVRGAGQTQGKARPRVTGVRAQTQAGQSPGDLGREAWSFWGLAGQLLLIEAHDMVHKLVLLTRLDHATPAQQRCKVGWGHQGMGHRKQPPNTWSTDHP